MSQPLTEEQQSDEVRFGFGANWKAFLESLDEARIQEAVASLRENLLCESYAGKRFLDIGSGSGLFSLAAHRLGCDVVSIDYDRESVACTKRLKEQFGDSSRSWSIDRGSVLDPAFMNSIGTFDIVYSWGVLHHTGDMKRAILLASERVKPGGKFFISIYNHQGGASRRWLKIKRIYNRLPPRVRPIWVIMIAGVYELKFAFARLLQGRNPLPFADWKAKRRDRGMSAWHDWVDWVGGLPFEVATPEAIIMPLREQGFVLDRLKTVGHGWGCNEYVFHNEM
ncbi:bifunctional 3-demethylubiquinone-9 3-methyltransferase/ 2-octaprenyl-6-hydroxy phenol methylase [Novipirellula aureliae]|uniref:Bifunctional 3-demethylubiquinone-9 3-methyltransferase/ 2-octaprenyl-6-hydroxy phenol methylase n=1 Tax=Novipirellula aureliae TaxID=2527966 RepID=A0A5C6DQ84_9BACT|nr:class I SAM-dependent methyltransferase [Novipirellula aureliae]TWU38990.1 bifunctional 3-demethylubiquinone-9 3-methyltransferase/ 2-octaprenyl-6-hydroxy phenol methylase [Novipirellula aureliae]